MIKGFEEKVIELANTPLVVSTQLNYSNNVELSGFILQKPKSIYNPKSKKLAVTFILVQIFIGIDGDVSYSSFLCITYAETIIKKLLSINNVAFITAIGKMAFNKVRKSYDPNIVSLEIAMESDYELLPPYERKD